MRRLLFLAVALIVYGSLYPWHFHFDPGAEPLFTLLHSWPVGWNRFILRDTVFNIFIYMPVGALFVVAFFRKPRMWAILPAGIFGMLLSGSMEMLQVYVPGRDCSLADLVSNTCGTLAGAAAALLFAPASDRAAHRRGRRTPLSPLVLLIPWTCAQLYPFFPALSRTHLRNTLLAVLAPIAFSPADILTVAAGWFAAAVLLEALFGRFKPLWFLAALLCLPLRGIIATRTLHLEEVCGGAIALALWTVLPTAHRLRFALALMAAAIVVSELAPLRFSATAAHFSWIPFGATMASARESGLIVFCRKLFDYGSLLWLANRCGISYAAGAAVLAPALLVMEFAQRYMPGRIPEITDSVMAILMALALWFSDLRTRRGLP